MLSSRENMNDVMTEGELVYVLKLRLHIFYATPDDY